jgi:Protein of unknown function, DUF599
MFLSLEHHAGRGPPRTQAARLKPASHAGNIPGNSDPKPMTILTLPDLAAFVWFVGAWIVYSIVIERSAKGRTALNALMNRYRDEWMERLLDRDMRMVDAQVTAALQNGAAFFASTSLIAIGGALTLLRSSEEIMTVMSLLPFGATARVRAGEIEFLDADDMAYSAAEFSGLVSRYGDDLVQATLALAFMDIPRRAA